jgi:hypothetical protein
MSEKVKIVFWDVLDEPEVEDDSNNTFMFHNPPNMSVLDALKSSFTVVWNSERDFPLRSLKWGSLLHLTRNAQPFNCFYVETCVVPKRKLKR